MTAGAPRKVLIIGAGGLAREVLAVLRALPEQWIPVGLLDDDTRLHGTIVDGVPVLGPSGEASDRDEAVVVCVGSARHPRSRLDLARSLGLADDRWATVVHPAAHLAPGVEIGGGTVVLAGVVVTAPVPIGAHVVAMPHVLVTHDDAVADGVTFAGRATLAGRVQVREAAYLGQGSLIREDRSVGVAAVVGMGAVVLDDVPDGEVWAGVPAHRIDGPATEGAA